MTKTELFDEMGSLLNQLSELCYQLAACEEGDEVDEDEEEVTEDMDDYAEGYRAGRLDVFESIKELL